ncbi:PhzF family phenazine biosynthesis protein [Orenia marismortui]|uniref:PhzF family phenazine biosynthesis protein n=1 Tax=Orenia marismortui TaxID=46469 RepID=A0A4R8GG62_9FIRM|nr:PhzF family phenazine biosynthesis protein [Orenia marismortui]TDX44502.1 PhzF family phenazine biosynthesis protein [Orenia marismortui]
MKIYQVDAFTDKAFKGNPAAVCILSELKEDSWMQNVAGEMNLSETAFLYKEKEGYNLRWFTPKHEEDLCGHATLASAYVLWETQRVGEDEEIYFNTRSGVLTAKKNKEWIELNFPIEAEKEVETPDMLIKALGIKPKYIGRNRLDFLVEVESEEIVRNIKPDFKLLESVKTRGVIVTSKSSSEKYDFVSRFFAPEVGVNEDPVTGSAHCCLAPFWKKKLKKDEFLAYQASERGGMIKVRLEKDRVYLNGKAVMILDGRLLK